MLNAASAPQLHACVKEQLQSLHALLEGMPSGEVCLDSDALTVQPLREDVGGMLH